MFLANGLMCESKSSKTCYGSGGCESLSETQNLWMNKISNSIANTTKIEFFTSNRLSNLPEYGSSSHSEYTMEEFFGD